MPDMNNRITQAVLFTVRDIEHKEIFKGITPKASRALIDYFMSRNDGLTSWLNNYAQSVIAKEVKPTQEDNQFDIDSFKSIPQEIQEEANKFEGRYGNVYTETSSLVDSIIASSNLGDLQAIKGSFMAVYNDLPEDEKSQCDLIHSYLCRIPDNTSSKGTQGQECVSFSIDHYNDQLATTLLDSPETHCDKHNPMVRDRLAYYLKEDEGGNTAVFAVYPWTGDTDSNHNNNWASALISTILYEYPSVKKLLLVCHDLDYYGFRGQDEVVKEGFIDKIKGSFKELEDLGLIVFQHGNDFVISTLNKSKAGDVYNAIWAYWDGFDTITHADNNDLNADAHEYFCKNYSLVMEEKDNEN